MTTTLIKLFLFTFSLAALLPVQTVLADTGPKPTMDFQLTFESGVEQSSIVSGILFECNESDCSDAAPLEELGPQGLYCDGESCSAIGYGFAPYLMLELEFSDGVTRRSNIFQQAGFDSFYTVFVRPQDLLVEAQASPFKLPVWETGIIACACFVGLGVGLVLLVFFLRRRAKA